MCAHVHTVNVLMEGQGEEWCVLVKGIAKKGACVCETKLKRGEGYKSLQNVKIKMGNSSSTILHH